MLEIAAHPHERPPRIERLPEDLEQRSALLQGGEHPAVENEILVGHLVEQPCGVADEESLLGIGKLHERRPDDVEESALRVAQRFVVELAPQLRATDADADPTVVQ